MKLIQYFLLSIIGLIFLEGISMATEEAKYTALRKDKDFELREYASQIVAETIVEGEFKKVGNEGFRRLFRYISGNNRAKQSISMTTPVTQESGSQKIPMTAPVSQEKAGDQWRITFLMPASSTLETLPEPLDPKVRLIEIPRRFMAAITYSGTWSRTRYEEQRERLVAWMMTQGFKSVGDPVWARYNPPFTPWFLRKNEVLIPVDAGEK
jgi:effector-binding domain-containing protein